jgi:tRNA(Arg) A34 adenosine deaminase TadA
MNPSFMRQAIRLSRDKMRQNQGGPFGAVIVRNQGVVGRGWNRVTSTNDPTAHAEIVAIRSASRKLGTFDLGDCELYTSCEPCPMCLAAIYWARIPTVYFANTQTDAAAIGFDDALFYEELARPLAQRQLKMVPLLRDEALAVFQEWQTKPNKTRY